MKVLISAYACEPGRGSEAEVGLRVLLAAATEHDVWLITRENNLAPLRAFLAGHPDRSRITLHGVDVPGVRLRLKNRLGRPGLYAYYDRWQRAAARLATRLDAEVSFDVVHHATFATYWARAGVAEVDKPLVWGPVGGGVEVAPALAGELGAAGLARDAARFVARRVLERLPRARRAPDRAAVTFVQNPATARRVKAAGEVVVLPNATAVAVTVPTATARSGDVVFAGSLIPLKGARLAVRALGHLRHRDARLHLYGDGPDRRRVGRAAWRRGVAHRVSFEGWVPRPALLEAVAGAGVLVHPALHDEAGLAVAEALALGTPVVCLDHGGPAEVVRNFPDSPAQLVRPGRPGATARRIAAAVDAFLDAPPPVPSEPFSAARPFAAEILAAYRRAAGTG